jgi:predicted DNA-binding transcriptional regulator
MNVKEMDILYKEEIVKIVDGCYYGQAMTFEENQLIKELIEKQQEKIEKLEKAFKSVNRNNKKYNELKALLKEILADN